MPPSHASKPGKGGGPWGGEGEGEGGGGGLGIGGIGGAGEGGLGFGGGGGGGDGGDGGGAGGEGGEGENAGSRMFFSAVAVGAPSTTTPAPPLTRSNQRRCISSLGVREMVFATAAAAAAVVIVNVASTLTLAGVKERTTSSAFGNLASRATRKPSASKALTSPPMVKVECTRERYISPSGGGGSGCKIMSSTISPKIKSDTSHTRTSVGRCAAEPKRIDAEPSS